MKLSPSILLLLSRSVAGSEGVTEAIGNLVPVSTWRPDLPWSKLESNLSSTASLIDASPSDYVEECAAEYDKPQYPNYARSNHGLRAKPSGICLPHLLCAFENCMAANPDQPARSFEDGVTDLINIADHSALYSEINATIKGWIDDVSNPTYSLPPKVLFPTSAGDIVAAVRFAKEHGLELSVKNSGHSYTGASSKGGTLLLNMRDYQSYAANQGPMDCDPNTINDSLDDQPCKLSLAKDKIAVIRVGGGENWGEVYKSVQDANKAQPNGYKYHAVGGYAGTVSPMGWTFQGGLSGSTAGRAFGFGVDQVVQIEMVLPNGEHVRFGPTKWEMVEGYDVPKTLSVTGLCNANPFDDESNWSWEDCIEDIPFDDLWFAVRGGGGGWGVITSLYLQIYEYLPLELITLRPTACVADKLDDGQAQAWDFAAQVFRIKYLLDPTSINVTEEVSNACASPPGTEGYFCFGEGSGSRYNDAWKNYLDSNRWILEDAGVASEVVDEAISCEVDFTGTDKNSTTIVKYNDFPETTTIPDNGENYYPGLAADAPPPGYRTNDLIFNLLVPAKAILGDIDTAAVLFPPDSDSYRAFGGKASGAASDQMNSLSDAHREAGYMVYLPFTNEFEGTDFKPNSFFEEWLPLFYDTSDKENFPGFLGGNHAGPMTRGPLKDDWTKACPLEWTQKERDEKCVPLQECIWGTKLLRRLEAIKEAIDPNYMFDCNGCIGNNRHKTSNSPPNMPPSEDPTSGHYDDPAKLLVSLVLAIIMTLALSS